MHTHNSEDDRRDNKMNPNSDHTSITDQSPAQSFIKKIDRRDKLVRIIEIVFLVIAISFTIFGLIRIQQLISLSQQETLQRSEKAAQERGETKQYIRCILLIRFDNPPETLTTREGVAKALDNCATESRKKQK